MTAYDIDYIKMANENRGFHFFSKGALRFFSSRICPTVYQGTGGVYFITSEQFRSPRGNGVRMYTVRQFIPETGNIETTGEFNVMTRSQSVREAKRLAKGAV